MPDLPDVRWTKVMLCVVLAVLVAQVVALDGPNVCMVKQKYNITKLVKYRAPMSIRTYTWCFSMPPRCSNWKTEMRDLTKLETDERTAEMAVCCPGYKMRDVSCVPICPNGKTGARCLEDCPQNKWGPNCVNDCRPCDHGSCSPVNGDCQCEDGWQGESCETSMPTTAIEDILITTKTSPTTTAITSSTKIATTSQATSTTTLATTLKITPDIIPRIVKVTEKAPEIISGTKNVRTKSDDVNATLTTTSNIFLTTNMNITDNKLSTAKPVIVNEIADRMTIENKRINDIKINSIVTENTTLRNVEISEDSVKDNLIDATSMTTSTTSKPILIEEFNKNKTAVINDTGKTSTTLILIVNKTETPIATTKDMEAITKKPTARPITTTVTETSKIKFTVMPKAITTTEKPLTQVTTSVIELTTHTEMSTKSFPTTIKFKPKEIWIRPAQKGDSTEMKVKTTHELQKHKSTNKEVPLNTTPKTIIVSIIPTSVSYAIFKNIALTTAVYIPPKSNFSVKSSKNIEQRFTKPMSTFSATTTSSTRISTTSLLNTTLSAILKPTTLIQETYENTPVTAPVSEHLTTKPVFKTNSMATKAVTSSNNLTVSTNTTTTTLITTPKTIETTKILESDKHRHWMTVKESIKNNKTLTPKLETVVKNKTMTKKFAITNNKTITNNSITTETPADEETFHILTEPEHITAVMGDRANERSSMDLKSVISIAGGVMMTVITVAVIIVMIERCRRPRYEDVRKINDIRMQVMIDSNDVPPPPYVRSIFRTPLPDPPISDKCHYQPISTLDRNLKQFMRPVVVQTISPIMLENFRGILECHYDHLPRRSHDFHPMPVRHSMAPSFENCCELQPLRTNSDIEHAIDAIECEAKLDEIDNTTSEPLYAEIPCWRPPSEHAVEIMNLNGEAVTEL